MSWTLEPPKESGYYWSYLPIEEYWTGPFAVAVYADIDLTYLGSTTKKNLSECGYLFWSEKLPIAPELPTQYKKL